MESDLVDEARMAVQFEREMLLTPFPYPNAAVIAASSEETSIGRERRAPVMLLVRGQHGLSFPCHIPHRQRMIAVIRGRDEIPAFAIDGLYEEVEPSHAW